MPAIKVPEVEAVFHSYPNRVRKKLLKLRQLIFKTAAATEGVGVLQETLKWGEPAYLTSQSKSGSTIRIAWKKARPDHVAMYFNCQTDLVERFREDFGDELEFEGNRAIVLSEHDELPEEALATCIASALRYHLDK